VFTEPERFRLYRPAPVYDIGFGYGRHFCVGHALSRTEMEQALLVLTRRLKNVRFDGAQELRPSGVIAGFERMPAVFETG